MYITVSNSGHALTRITLNAKILTIVFFISVSIINRFLVVVFCFVLCNNSISACWAHSRLTQNIVPHWACLPRMLQVVNLLWQEVMMNVVIMKRGLAELGGGECSDKAVVRKVKCYVNWCLLTQTGEMKVQVVHRPRQRWWRVMND